MWPFKHRHRWTTYLKISADRHRIYSCRECVCGADQVRLDGPMGDKSWRDSNRPLKYEWEQRAFKSAQRLTRETEDRS